jgi:hypothetical protein
MSKEKSTNYLELKIGGDILEIVGKQVARLKRKTGEIETIDVAYLEKYTKIYATVMGVIKDADAGKLSDDEIAALAGDETK